MYFNVIWAVSNQALGILNSHNPIVQLTTHLPDFLPPGLFSCIYLFKMPPEMDTISYYLLIGFIFLYFKKFSILGE